MALQQEKRPRTMKLVNFKKWFNSTLALLWYSSSVNLMQILFILQKSVLKSSQLFAASSTSQNLSSSSSFSQCSQITNGTRVNCGRRKCWSESTVKHANCWRSHYECEWIPSVNKLDWGFRLILNTSKTQRKKKTRTSYKRDI